jgi:O-antigen/teichoic acid export membrane protein
MRASDADDSSRAGPERLMAADAGRTLRNAGWLAAQRLLHVAGAALFAILVPRLLGPAVFGRYALLVSVSMWFSLLSSLGAVSMMTRSIPRFQAAGDQAGLRRLATSLMALRAITGTASAAGFFLVAMLLLGEPDRIAIALVAATVAARAVGNLGFALLLGLNEAARWGMGELSRRWLTLPLVPVGYLAAGLRGACAGLLTGELLVLALGLWWARPYLGRSLVDLSRRHLSPFLRAGGLFAAGNLLLALTQRTGEAMVRFSTGSYEEVGYFGAAYAIYQTVAHGYWQVVVSLAPHLIVELEHGRRDVVARWLERLMTYAVAAAVVLVAGAVLVGQDLVAVLLGPDYASVALNIVPLTATLLALAAGQVGRLLALTLDRPGMIIVAAGLELAAFWLVGFPLAARMGSLGACLATLPAAVLYAGYLTATLRPALPYSLAAAGRALLAAVVFVPLTALRGRWEVNTVLFATGTLAYVCVLGWARVVSRGDVADLRRALGRPASVPASGP